MELSLCRRALGWGLVGALFSCAPSEPRREPATDPVRARFEAAQDRLLAMTEPRGWVVSRWEDGRVEHTGDSLLWTGMAMGVMDCDPGTTAEDALLGMLEANAGRVYRHPTEAMREPSLDGHLGLYWGISQRVARCPASAQKWADALTTHVPVNVPEDFYVVLDAVRHVVGSAAAPDAVRVARLSHLVAGWSGLVVAQKAAGYRIHLALLALQTTGGDAAPFCLATRGAGIELVEHFCGRSDLAGWIDAFAYDRGEYAHQRAKWESLDGKPGLNTPGLDLLVAMRAAYIF